MKPGDRIDVQDQEGDWFETIVRKVVNNKIVCHFWGFANIWDCTIEFNPSKIAPVHTYSERSKFKDHEKLLGECVWEILAERNMLNQNKQCTQASYIKMQQETGILTQDLMSYLDTADATDSMVCFTNSNETKSKKNRHFFLPFFFYIFLSISYQHHRSHFRRFSTIDI